MTALLLTADDQVALRALRDTAARDPVDVVGLMATINTPRGDRLHRARMEALTYTIDHGPWPFVVTFSIETGQPAGTCRHMSMSIAREGRVPHPLAIWMVAEVLGFVGSFDSCVVYPEALNDGGTAINVVQPVSVQQQSDGATRH